ncbi:MAG: FAD-dependent oxidoreductase [Sedimentisphaerales bacterium]|jgi:alkyl hydroperoxide reductase subunit F
MENNLIKNTIDPICGMGVDSNRFSATYNEKTYLFCSQGCKDKFEVETERYEKEGEYDLLIIGAGPGGLTAAVYASVMRLHTFLISQDVGGQAIDSTKVKNYMGFDFITGPELVEKFRDQFLHRHYLEHVMDEVTGIVPVNGYYQVTTRSKRSYQARAVIVATGMKRRKLGIPGEQRLLRKGVSHSALQDTSLFAGKPVVVVGGGNSGVQTARGLLQSGCKVTLVEKANVTADPSEIELLSRNLDFEMLDRHDVTEIYGEESVEGVEVQFLGDLAKRRIPCAGVFIQVGLIPNTEFCLGLLDINDKGEIKIGPDCSTSAEGIFACGDVTEISGKRIIIASGEGAKAALSAKQYLARIGETIKQ